MDELCDVLILHHELCENRLRRVGVAGAKVRQLHVVLADIRQVDRPTCKTNVRRVKNGSASNNGWQELT